MAGCGHYEALWSEPAALGAVCFHFYQPHVRINPFGACCLSPEACNKHQREGCVHWAVWNDRATDKAPCTQGSWRYLTMLLGELHRRERPVRSQLRNRDDEVSHL